MSGRSVGHILWHGCAVTISAQVTFCCCPWVDVDHTDIERSSKSRRCGPSDLCPLCCPRGTPSFSGHLVSGCSNHEKHEPESASHMVRPGSLWSRHHSRNIVPGVLDGAWDWPSSHPIRSPESSLLGEQALHSVYGMSPMQCTSIEADYVQCAGLSQSVVLLLATSHGFGKSTKILSSQEAKTSLQVCCVGQICLLRKAHTISCSTQAMSST